MAQDKEFVSYKNHNKVAYELSCKVEIFDLCFALKGQGHWLKSYRNITQTVWYREFVSTEDHYEVAYGLSKKMK